MKSDTLVTSKGLVQSHRCGHTIKSEPWKTPKLSADFVVSGVQNETRCYSIYVTAFAGFKAGKAGAKTG